MIYNINHQNSTLSFLIETTAINQASKYMSDKNSKGLPGRKNIFQKF